MMPIAAPAITFPRCGQFSSIRYGFFIALIPGNALAPAGPRCPAPAGWPRCAAAAAHTTIVRASTPIIRDRILPRSLLLDGRVHIPGRQDFLHVRPYRDVLDVVGHFAETMVDAGGNHDDVAHADLFFHRPLLECGVVAWTDHRRHE